MNRKDIATLALVAVTAGILSLIIAGKLFSSAQRPVKVPVAQTLNADFPDVRNDPNLRAIFNNNALDPTQLIQIGNSQNSAPFNGQ